MAQEGALQEMKKLDQEFVADTTGCPFCGIEKTDRVVEKFGTMVAIKDKYPVTEFHMLVMPMRHTPDFVSMTSQERRDAETLILSLQEQITESDPRVTGFNIGINCERVGDVHKIIKFFKCYLSIEVFGIADSREGANGGRG
jgi:hypothetical protein